MRLAPKFPDEVRERELARVERVLELLRERSDDEEKARGSASKDTSDAIAYYSDYLGQLIDMGRR